MSDALIYRPAGTGGLYLADAPAGAPPVYYVTADPSAAVGSPLPLFFLDTWSGAAAAGWYVAPSRPPADPAAFAAAVRAFAASIAMLNPRVLWCGDPDAAVLSCGVLSISPDGRKTQSSAIKLRDMQISADDGIPVLAAADGTLTLDSGPGAWIKQDRPDIMPPPTVFADGPATLRLGGGTGGLLAAQFTLTRGLLAAYGGEIRWFSGYATQPDWLAELLFPVLDLGAEGAPPNGIALAATVHFALPEADTLTCWRFIAADPLPSFWHWRDWGAVSLAPDPASARFYLAPRPGNTNGNAAGYYLAPAGDFAPQVPGDAPAALPCGTYGGEYVQLRAGDVLRFVPGRNVLAFAFKAQLPETAEPTPSEAPPAVPEEALVLPEEVPGSWVTLASAVRTAVPYFAQPAVNSYYRALPAAGNGRSMLPVCEVEAGAFSGAPAVPMVPLAGIGMMVSAGAQRINRFPDAVLAAFEQQVVSGQRPGLAPIFATGPIFHSPPPMPPAGAAAGSVEEPAERWGLTPHGLLASLSEGGEWASLIIGCGRNGDQRPLVRFDPPPETTTISPVLGAALMKDQLFLVISQEKPISPGGGAAAVSNIGIFLSELGLESFRARLTPGVPDAHGGLGSVLIFKFRTDRSLEQLCAHPREYWSYPENFNAGSGDDFPVKDQIREYIARTRALAPKMPPGTFDRFLAILGDPGWQGILALNATLPPDGVPLALVGLRGGMTEELRIHNMAIEATPVDVSTGTVRESVVSGLILYPPLESVTAPFVAPAEPTGVDYAVRSLRVRFANSRLADFSCRIDLTLNRLFGREVQQQGRAGAGPGGGNVIAIDGNAQTHDGTTVFTFTGAGGRFEIEGADKGLVRVLEGVGVKKASFTTKSCVPSPKTEGAYDVATSFTLTGALGFAPDALAFDLFGFGKGDGATDLPVSGMAVNASFTLGPDGFVVPGTRTVAFSAAAMTLTAEPGVTPRAGSLLQSLPLVLDSFVADPAGLSAAKLNGQPVNLTGISPDPGVPDMMVTTRAPQYAIGCKLPLGSLGSLSTVGIDLSAYVSVGWGPSPNNPNQDAVGLAVRLPFPTPGFMGFSLQGVLRTTFGSANLARFLPADGQPPFYILTLSNIGLSLFGFKLPPGFVVDLMLWSRPTPARPNGDNIAWFVAVTPEMKTPPAPKGQLAGEGAPALPAPVPVPPAATRPRPRRPRKRRAGP